MPVPISKKLPEKEETPENLKPYYFHGIHLSVKGEEANGECPFCSRDKFSVRVESGLYNCLVCGASGNGAKLLQELWKMFDEATDLHQYLVLAEDRDLQHNDTLVRWEVVYSSLCDEWMIPGYNKEGTLTQLYRYTKVKDKLRLVPTPTFGHAIFGMSVYQKSKPEIYLCEGPWDAMALWEVLSQVSIDNDRNYTKAHRIADSVSKEVSVLATPGCNVFLDSWKPLFKGKSVTIFFDNDHPKINANTQQEIPPAGYSGVERIASILKGTVSELNFVQWGPKGFDPSFPSGIDVRDVLSGATNV